MRAKKRRANQSARAEQTTRTARQSDLRLSDARGQAYNTRPGVLHEAGHTREARRGDVRGRD